LSIAMILAMAAAAATLTACGGSEPSPPGADETVVDTHQVPTVGAQAAPVDQATRDLAAAAVLRAADFGPGFTEVTAASEWTPEEGSCAFETGGPESRLGDGAVLDGPTVQVAGQDAFADSRAYAFPTDSDAMAWISIAAGKAWSDCIVGEQQEIQADSGSDDARLSIESLAFGVPGDDGFKEHLRILGRDREQDVVLDISVKAYRYGNVVILDTTRCSTSDEVALQLDSGEQAALEAAHNRVMALDPSAATGMPRG
jgi:hypothetical protein